MQLHSLHWLFILLKICFYLFFLQIFPKRKHHNLEILLTIGTRMKRNGFRPKMLTNTQFSGTFPSVTLLSMLMSVHPLRKSIISIHTNLTMHYRSQRLTNQSCRSKNFVSTLCFIQFFNFYPKRINYFLNNKLHHSHSFCC